MTTTARKIDAAQRTQTLTDELSAALEESALVEGQPLVIENRIAQTKSVHVAIVWDAWGNLPSADRSKIIMSAYSKARRLRGSTITVAMGLTSEEALRMGFLPYSIVTTHRQGDKASLNELARAMAGAGGIVSKVGSSMQLRFATRQQAEDAYRYLSQQVPGPYWAIVQEQPAAE